MSIETPILRIAVPSPLRFALDYLPPPNCDLSQLTPGSRVLVPFRNQELIGLLTEVRKQSDLPSAKLKPALAILDKNPLLPKSIVDLLIWTSEYYHHPIGDVVVNALPSLLREKPSIEALEHPPIDITTIPQIATELSVTLNHHQQQCITTIRQNLSSFNPILLDGVTGSGKTEVYLRIIAEIIQADKQALVLVPEINLTPQTIARFEKRFSVPIAVFHSRRNHKERLMAWLMAQNGTAPIVIGTRSAIFTPLKNPGIIILDEEHDLSFKQEAGLRYSARDLSIVRSQIENIPVILGSATPSLETFYNAKRKRYLNLELPVRAGNAIHPSFHLVDMRNQKLKNGLADSLLQAMQQHLDNNGQIITFINRRGYAPVLLCHSCGWTANCKHCDARLTLHQKQQQLHCHHCGIIMRIPTQCPKCQATNLIPLGAGTERIEATLQTQFPDAKLVRIDRDTTRRKGSIQKILKAIGQNQYHILIGTQMLAKGHHFPEVTMVVILDVDHSLFSSDFRANEHLAQLIIQVSGRAGRTEKPGEVYIQTHNPHHPLLLSLINEGYHHFVENSLTERKTAHLPPFSYLALLRAESKHEGAALKFLTQLRTHNFHELTNQVQILGPVPTLMERKAGVFRAQLLLQSQSREKLHQMIENMLKYIEALKPKSHLKWQLDIDPTRIN